MKNRRKRLIILIGIPVLAAVILSAVLIIRNINRGVVFYYPDLRSHILKAEKRTLSRAPADKADAARIITMDYILGPVTYDLRVPLPDNVGLKSVYRITNKGRSGLVLDFNKAFVQAISNNNDDVREFLDGLCLTLKKNTSVKRLFILADGRALNLRAGRYDLAYPVTVDRFTTEKTR